jgi:hypothetical protein
MNLTETPFPVLTPLYCDLAIIDRILHLPPKTFSNKTQFILIISIIIFACLESNVLMETSDLFVDKNIYIDVKSSVLCKGCNTAIGADKVVR